jgi:hypothetical protein
MREGAPRKPSVEMKNVDPKALAEAKAALAALRKKEQDFIELDDADLELIPEETPKKEKLTFAVAEAGSQGEIKATTEYKGFDPAAMKERRLQEGVRIVSEMLKIRDAESLRESLEGKLQSAQDQLEDLDEDQDTMRASAQLEADIVSAQLKELDRLTAEDEGRQAA